MILSIGSRGGRIPPIIPAEANWLPIIAKRLRLAINNGFLMDFFIITPQRVGYSS